MKGMIKREFVAHVLRSANMAEDLIRAVLDELGRETDASVPRDKKWKEQFPDTLYVMEPMTKNTNPDDDQEFQAYSGTEGGEGDDVYAVYELMGFVKVTERKTKHIEDV